MGLNESVGKGHSIDPEEDSMMEVFRTAILEAIDEMGENRHYLKPAVVMTAKRLFTEGRYTLEVIKAILKMEGMENFYRRFARAKKIPTMPAPSNVAEIPEYPIEPDPEMDRPTKIPTLPPETFGTTQPAGLSRSEFERMKALAQREFPAIDDTIPSGRRRLPTESELLAGFQSTREGLSDVLDITDLGEEKVAGGD